MLKSDTKLVVFFFYSSILYIEPNALTQRRICRSKIQIFCYSMSVFVELLRKANLKLVASAAPRGVVISQLRLPGSLLRTWFGNQC